MKRDGMSKEYRDVAYADVEELHCVGRYRSRNQCDYDVWCDLWSPRSHLRSSKDYVQKDSNISSNARLMDF